METHSPGKDTNRAKYTYTRITREESETLGADWIHCVHVMLHAPLVTTVHLFDNPNNEIKHTIMMQMRFDGRLGFPGGFVDKTDASLEDALLREVSEEMGDLPCGFQFLPEDYLFAFRCEEKRYCLHFYSKEVTFSEFLSIETRNEKQPFEGFEVLGCIRVPLYAFGNVGFPTFLRHNFIGCSRTQLLQAILKAGILTQHTLNQYIALSKLDDPLSSTYFE